MNVNDCICYMIIVSQCSFDSIWAINKRYLVLKWREGSFLRTVEEGLLRININLIHAFIATKLNTQEIHPVPEL
jgi:hypothetical protein